MTSKNSAVTKNLTNKHKVFLFLTISVFVVVLILGIQKAYAYYHDSVSKGILANKVGDFDLGDGDINMMIYRENEEGKFVRIYAVPADYYVFNDELTSCTIPCNDGLGNCSYSYDANNRTFALTSNQKITCKFYFEQEEASDINVYIMIENPRGTYNYNFKKYSISDYVPAYGYVYSDNYECDDAAELTYNAETKKFSVATATKNTCYVYFSKVGDADITVNTYVQEEYGVSTYASVESIPANKIYTLNDELSNCIAVSATGNAGVITYEDGYISVIATGQQVCDVYLDLESN